LRDMRKYVRAMLHNASLETCRSNCGDFTSTARGMDAASHRNSWVESNPKPSDAAHGHSGLVCGNVIIVLRRSIEKSDSLMLAHTYSCLEQIRKPIVFSYSRCKLRLRDYFPKFTPVNFFTESGTIRPNSSYTLTPDSCITALNWS
jgi:hypothetical protein